MVLEKLPELLLNLVTAAFESSAAFTAVTTVVALTASIWWLRRPKTEGISQGLSSPAKSQASAAPSSKTTVVNKSQKSQDNSVASSTSSSRPSSIAASEDDDGVGETQGIDRDDNDGDESDDSGLGAPQPEEREYERVPYEFQKLTDQEMVQRSEEFLRLMKKRRTIRNFSSDPIPEAVLDNLLKTAGSSPSGANAQPWTYVVISDPDLKEEVRRIVELEEEMNYERRMGKTWVNDLKPFKLSWEKPYLTEAPHLILVFKQVHSFDPETGKKRHHYYQEISVSLSVGILLAAIQNAGLVTLTSTPLNCGPGIRTLLNRPEYEKLLLLLPVGYPAKDATVPKLERKSMSDFVVRL